MWSFYKKINKKHYLKIGCYQLPCYQILVFWGISKIALAFFLSFLVFHPQKHFSTQIYFWSPKTISRSISQIQPKYWTLFGGGGGKKTPSPFPRKFQSPILSTFSWSQKRFVFIIFYQNSSRMFPENVSIKS